MTPPGFRKALNERGDGRGEKKALHVDARFLQGFQMIPQFLKIHAASGVDRHRDALVTVLFQVECHFFNEGNGEIVDAVVPRVFQLTDGDGFSGAGKSGDDD